MKVVGWAMMMFGGARALRAASRAARRTHKALRSVATEAPPAKDAGLTPDISMDALVALCRKRGFVFGSSEIYNGFNGFYDYGPLGVELKQNIKECFWRDFVRGRDDIVGLDSSIIANPAIWEASGHVAGFSDPMVDDRTTKKRYRADQLFYAEVVVDGESLGCVTVQESEATEAALAALAEKVKRKAERKAGKQGTLAALAMRCVADAGAEDLSKIPPPDDVARAGDLTAPVAFNLMFGTTVGAKQDSSAAAYLRPETAQGIFVNFKNVCQSARAKIPFGIAQVGKAFRNEITPRNFIFRSREFEQMEIEYFIEPGDGWRTQHETWVAECHAWLLESIGLRKELLGFEVHDKLAHYARACTDVTFRFPFGESELLGVAARGDFDLTQHQGASGKSLEYFDEGSKSKFLPHVIEPSIGVDRLFLAVLCSAYAEDEQNGETRQMLKLHPAVAPVKCAILPLIKKDEKIMALARGIEKKLRRRFNVEFDVAGQIGRRYRRQDEIGTPFCVTVDFESIEDGCVTIRDRDTTHQQRIPIDDVYATVAKAVDGF